MKTEYIDSIGRKFLVDVADENEDPKHGIIIGPPFLDDLELPLDVMVKVHNELYDRRLFTWADVRVRQQDVMGAVMSVFKLDAIRIMEKYKDG